jgi:hypothetical protein
MNLEYRTKVRNDLKIRWCWPTVPKNLVLCLGQMGGPADCFNEWKIIPKKKFYRYPAQKLFVAFKLLSDALFSGSFKARKMSEQNCEMRSDTRISNYKSRSSWRGRTMSKLLLSRDQTKPLIVNFNEAFGSMIERAPPINAACSNRHSKN